MTSLEAVIGALLVKPALVLAAAVGIAACLRRQSAAARHLVFAGAIVAIIALPVLSIVLPPIPLAVPFLPIEPSLPSAHPSATGGNAAPNGMMPTIGGVSRRSVLSGRAGGDGAAPDEQVALAIVAIWILGVLLLGARRVAAQLQVRRIVRRGRRAMDPRLERLLTNISRHLGLRRQVRVCLSEEIAAPAVVGVFRPVVLLPATAFAYCDAELSQVLVHELGHVARWDCALNLVGDLAATLYWCNPFVHMAVRRMRADGESACDDLVLRSGAEPEGYAQLLLAVAGATRLEGGLPSNATSMARPGELESRLLSVLDDRIQRDQLPRWMAPTLGGLGLLVALPAATITLQAAPVANSEQLLTEPDRRGDSLAGPASERLPFVVDEDRVSLGARDALAGPDSALARSLITALGHRASHSGDLVRERAQWALSQVEGGRLVEAMLGALESSDWRVQAYAAWTLAASNDRRVVPRLIPLLDHPVWRVRAMAAAALRALRDPAAQDAMSRVLTDPAWQVRVEAVQYLADLGGPTLSNRLRPMLADRHVAVRLAAEDALSFR